jgi:hypothetical protein
MVGGERLVMVVSTRMYRVWTPLRALSGLAFRAARSLSLTCRLNRSRPSRLPQTGSLLRPESRRRLPVPRGRVAVGGQRPDKRRRRKSRVRAPAIAIPRPVSMSVRRAAPVPVCGSMPALGAAVCSTPST